MSKHNLYGLMLPGATKFGYMGVTIYPKRRLEKHRRRWPGVKMSVLVVGSREYIYALETRSIRTFGTHVSRGGLNKNYGGFGSAGRVSARKLPKKKLARWYVEPPRKTTLDSRERNVSLVRLRQMLRHDAQRRRSPPPC
jgi:hypothetical protein